jgi:hypothetical protein
MHSDSNKFLYSNILNLFAIASVFNSIHFVAIPNGETSFSVRIHLCSLRFFMDVAGNLIYNIDLITSYILYVLLSNIEFFIPSYSFLATTIRSHSHDNSTAMLRFYGGKHP